MSVTNSMEQRITRVLRGKAQGMSFQKIVRDLKIAPGERKKLQKSLKNLEQQGVVVKSKSKFTLSATTRVVRGRFDSTLRGYGFVIPDDPAASGGEDIFVPAPYTMGAIEGDIVDVVVSRGRKGRTEGRVTRVVKKIRETIYGLYVERNGLPYLVPVDSPAAEEMSLSGTASFNPKPGMIVAVDRSNAKITSVLGWPDDPGVDTQVVIQRYGLRVEFSRDAASEAESIPALIPPDEMARRVDYRGWTSFTIDGEKAQDFDDAVSIRKLEPGGHFLLGVHIADVSHYVKPAAPLDMDAYARGTSVYFPDLTLPMLPEKLSNNLCSLRPCEDRLAVSALMQIDGRGEVVRTEFHPSVIRTVERLTYTSVFKIFSGDEEERRRLGHVVPDLLMMRELAAALRKKRVAEGSLDFDLTEPELVYSEGVLQSVAAFEPNEAHKLIEDFMIAANVAVATFLSRRGIPSVYRVHPPPSASDLDDLRTTLMHFGVFLPKSSKVTSKDLQAALETAESRPEGKFINIQVLRALRLAAYSEENVGHYGLAKEEYTHFTSPIRRYPDLMVHRILKDMLAGRRAETPAPGLAASAVHASHRERLADSAEKDLVEWRIYRLLKTKLGEEFTGTVVDYNKAGLVVSLDGYFVDGILAYGDMGGDYYYAKSRGTLVGRRTGRKFELGDRLRVALAAVDPLLRRMSLVLISEQGKKRS